MVGQTLGHYQIVADVGAGGMGVVYRAHDQRLDRDVALKVLPTGALSDDTARKRLRQEALALSKLNHSNIAAVYDFNTQNSVDYLVMEFIQGQPLGRIVRHNPLAEREVLEIGAAVAEALEEAHEHGLIHRDLKPGNIMIGPKQRVKVLDFGLAQFVHPNAVSEEETRSYADRNQVVGTLPYMPPEQLRGERMDHRSDIYSLGAVLYEMATGEMAFPQVFAPKLIDEILHSMPQLPSETNPKISPGLESIIVKAMDPDPERRYQSARELRVDLERLRSPSSVVPRTTHRYTQPVQLRRVARRMRAYIAVALVAALMAAGATYAYYTHRGAATDSIAVLPFVNSTNNPESDYLSDGITENLINELSQAPKLRVIARTTAFRFKGQKIDPQTVGHDLGVRLVLSGVVMQRGDQLDIQADLINVTDNTQVWGERYTRPATDLLNVQGDIASEILSKLKLRFTSDDQKVLTRKYTTDPEAYRLYLKGRYFSDKYTKEGIDKGIEYFRQAIDKDPTYALAYTAMATAYYEESSAYISPEDAMPKVKWAASKALQIDDSLAEAHTWLGMADGFYDRDLTAAEREFRRGIELNPGSVAVHQWYAYFLAIIGRPAEAAEQWQSAKKLDPLSSDVIWLIGFNSYLARNYDAAIEQLKAVENLDPNFWWSHLYAGLAYSQKHLFPQALIELEKANALGAGPIGWAYLGYVQTMAGNKAAAQRQLEILEEAQSKRYVSPSQLALVYLGVGERDKALELLEQAVQHHDDTILILNVDPCWDAVRNDNRFRKILQGAGLGVHPGP